MVNKNEEKPLLSFQDKDGNPREIFEKDLTDNLRPLVQLVSQDLRAEQELGEAFQLALKTVHHMESIRRNISTTIDKIEAELPPYKKPIKLEGVSKEVK